MKKYKLIKEYPRSPELDTIVNDELDQNYFYDEDISSDISSNKRFYINISEILRFSEFWQEVVEKEYEILSFKYDRSCIIIHKDSNGYYNHESIPIRSWKENHMLENQNFKIYSVKRLSDGEVFTIGDKIGDFGYNYEIKSLNITDQYKGGISIGVTIGGYLGIVDIKKTKQKLFTTEDGVDIFIGDKFYHINIEKYNIVELVAIYFSTTQNNFSTKEKAEEYIILNKPCLSLNDILEHCDDKEDINHKLSMLKNLIKSKLNIK